MMATQINLSWLELFNLINGVDGWKLALNLRYSHSDSWTKNWGEGGGAAWRGNKIELHIWGVEKRSTLLWIAQDDYKSTDADIEASRTWEKLEKFLLPFPKIDGSRKQKGLPKLTEEQKQEVIRINNLKISEQRKAEMMGVVLRHWQRKKAAAGISRHYNKKTT